MVGDNTTRHKTADKNAFNCDKRDATEFPDELKLTSVKRLRVDMYSFQSGNRAFSDHTQYS